MVPRLYAAGRSFRGLAQYLGHDPKAQTKERVAWTHTLNCAHDDVPSAVHEMYTTFIDAELLKQEAGIRGGGRSLDRGPVKHFSLNWAPGEQPERHEMIADVESFLERMGWREHQAVLFAHTDKDHAHVHVMLNRVHPDTGCALNDGLEYRRAQAWALEYERDHGRIYCEQRLLEPGQREASPDRHTWLALKEAEREMNLSEGAHRRLDPDYLKRDENRRVIENEEWTLLKARQREEREAFFAEGKQEFRELRTAIYREVREAFREVWAFYYAEKRADLDPALLAEMRGDILERQRTVLDERRTEACAALREERDVEYALLLAEQKGERHELVARQEQGLSSPHLLEWVNRKDGRTNADGDGDVTNGPDSKNERTNDGFRSAAAETCATGGTEEQEPWEEATPQTSAENPRVRDGATVVGDLGLGMIGAIATIGERLFDGFLGAAPAGKDHPPKTAPAPSKDPQEKPRAKASAAAQGQVERQQEEVRSRAYWEDRDRERGRD
jgi:hypothetical protein